MLIGCGDKDILGLKDFGILFYFDMKNTF